MRLPQDKVKTLGRRRASAPAREMIRQAANTYVVRRYPFGCLSGNQRQLIGKKGMWIVPVVLTSPGFGAVGEVGLVAVAAVTREVVGGTPRREVIAAMKQLREAQADALEAAFHRARTV